MTFLQSIEMTLKALTFLGIIFLFFISFMFIIGYLFITDRKRSLNKCIFFRIIGTILLFLWIILFVFAGSNVGTGNTFFDKPWFYNKPATILSLEK